MTTKERMAAKLPGEDTGITLHNTFCDICAPGPHCGVTCYVKDGKIIKVEGTDAHPTNHGKLCARGLAARDYVYRRDRMLTPLKRIGKKGEGKFQPISWDEAMAEITRKLLSVRAESGASSAAFYCGYEKWYRPFLQRLAYSYGSVNYGSESSSCFTSTIMSWKCATGAEMVQPDMKNAGVFLGFCANPGISSYLMNIGLQANHRRGMKVIIIDPRITPASQSADLHLRVKPGTDGALALCLGRELIHHDWIDRDYIRENVYGFDAYREYVEQFTPEKTAEITGLTPEEIRLAARMVGENLPLAINPSNASLVHFKNGMQNHRAVMALSAITGSYDRPGGMIPTDLTYAHSIGGFATGIFCGEVPQGRPGSHWLRAVPPVAQSHWRNAGLRPAPRNPYRPALSPADALCPRHELPDVPRRVGNARGALSAGVFCRCRPVPDGFREICGHCIARLHVL